MGRGRAKQNLERAKRFLGLSQLPYSSTSGAPLRIRSNGGIGNDYYTTPEDDDYTQPQTTSHTFDLSTQLSKRESEPASASHGLRSFLRLKATSRAVEVEEEVGSSEADEGEYVHNQSVAMRSDSYINFRALHVVKLPAKREGRLLRKFSSS